MRNQESPELVAARQAFEGAIRDFRARNKNCSFERAKSEVVRRHPELQQQFIAAANSRTVIAPAAASAAEAAPASAAEAAPAGNQPLRAF